jgi:hypothetical protein
MSIHHENLRLRVLPVTSVLLLGALIGCGSDSPPQAESGTGLSVVMPQVTTFSDPTHLPSESVVSFSDNTGSSTRQAIAATGAVNLETAALFNTAAVVNVAATPDPGVLLLLVPDGQNLADPRISAWVDAAMELGVRIQPVTDSQFLQLATTPANFAGLILPDGLHTVASDELIAAVVRYTQNGGKTMLVFDFGALTLQNGTPVYPVPKSRLSALAGVDYVLYDALRDRTTGLGPVTALKSTMRNLLVPPGKSLPYNGTLSSAFVSSTSTSTSPLTSPLTTAAGISSQTALYLPVSAADPGGVKGFDPQQYSTLPYSTSSVNATSPQVQINLGLATKASPVLTVTPMLSTTAAASDTLTTAAAVDPVHVYNGYLLGSLIYPSYVTQGSFGTGSGQTTLATSPQFGLVAGVNPVGAGQVLFVNLPLTYLKQRTDALMMHGFLKYFSRDMLNMAHLSSMPNGVAGMTYNWHLDSKAAQSPTQKLIKLNVFSDPQTLFSVNMTAGPDAVKLGDRQGWNLPSNPTAQLILKTFRTTGHSIGSHGGWIHDFYGTKVSETNQLATTSRACLNVLALLDNFEQCLVLNRQSVDMVTGIASREYSAPEGNNPPWAMSWQEKKGVVGAYFGGHTGLGATRQYRDGQLLNPGMWMFPVTPEGLYATFEEFQAYNVPQADVTAWYHEMVDFNVTQNTSRLVYAHPPGAALWSNVLIDLLTYAKGRGSQFTWYTMPRLADFMTLRQNVAWTQNQDAVSGLTQFTVSHPVTLNEMVWRLPKSRYAQVPVIVSGVATVVTTDAKYWLVKAGKGQQLVFKA